MKTEQLSTAAIHLGREHIARLAEADGQIIFAREVRGGCWDHRPDVATAITNAAKIIGVA